MDGNHDFMFFSPRRLYVSSIFSKILDRWTVLIIFYRTMILPQPARGPLAGKAGTSAGAASPSPIPVAAE